MNANTPLAVLILAAGKGTRMKSALPKVAHKLAGLPMICHIIRTCESLGAAKIIPILAPGMDMVAQMAAPHACAIQPRQLGSGDAARAALPLLDGFNGQVVILVGDAPLIHGETIRKLAEAAKETGIAVLGMRPQNPFGYGRLVQDEKGLCTRIVEERDASAQEKAITLCNAGNFCVDAALLPALLDGLTTDNDQKEYYLTDIVALAAAKGRACAVVEAPVTEVQGINDRIQLAAAEAALQNRLREKAMRDGATLIAPETVFFSTDTVLGTDVIVEPGVFFGPDVQVGDDVIIHAYSHLEGVRVENGAHIGPFARIRPHSHIGAGVTVGNFIEVNRTHMRAGSKSKHLSYLGDADIGEKTNIGAGTVIANYDGFNKLDTKIGQNVFVGSNSTIVAPVTINDGALIAAGSTVTGDVPEDALAIARPQMNLREGRASEYRTEKQALKKKKG